MKKSYFSLQYNNFKTNQLTSEILQMGTQLFDILAEEDANKVSLPAEVSRFFNIKLCLKPGPASASAGPSNCDREHRGQPPSLHWAAAVGDELNAGAEGVPGPGQRRPQPEARAEGRRAGPQPEAPADAHRPATGLHGRAGEGGGGHWSTVRRLRDKQSLPLLPRTEVGGV